MSLQMNVMSFLMGKSVASNLGEERSTQIGLLSGMLPGYQGVMMAAVIAQNETPTTKPTPSPDVIKAQLEELRTLIASLTPATPSQPGRT